jgi:hypothetical protein
VRKEKNEVIDDFICELDRIHNKAIFDSFNEALDYYRPFGIKGRPLPWKVFLPFLSIIKEMQ